MPRFPIRAILLILEVLIMIVVPDAARAQERDYPYTPVPFTAVHFEDAFWKPRLETNRTVTIPADFRRCEETGRIDNFAKAGRLMPGAFEGIYYNDSDVFKVIEGASYALKVRPDPALDAYLDDLIVKIAAAQEPDGYLYTIRTIDPNAVPAASGKSRWSNERFSHELYNIGHLYEAAVAHYLATGKRALLDVAIKSADLVDREFGPGKRIDPPGHQEIEIGLVKLYRVTHDERYLRLARFFLDMRGRNHDRRTSYEAYAQDVEPVVEQDHPVGHAVRAAYMYCGMADVAAIDGDNDYVRAIDRIWSDMACYRMFITGGIGARHGAESFGEDYELPNQSAYCETCAAIANALWNERMFLLHGDAQYIDVLERVLYNAFLVGVSLSGDEFFYVNPLASAGDCMRQRWYDCACCPTNVARFMPSIPGYVYARRGDALYVNLFVGSKATIEIAGQSIEIVQETQYPWAGDVAIRLTPAKPTTFTLRVRIPGWATGQPVPTDLYHDLNPPAEQPLLSVNGERVAVQTTLGYVAIERTWKPGDVVRLNLPMAVRRVVCHERVVENAGHVALERGPIVYCVEGADHGGRVSDLFVPDDAAIRAEAAPDTLGGIVTLRGVAARVRANAAPEPAALTAIPYCVWAHNEPGEMLVWLPRSADAVKPLRRAK